MSGNIENDIKVLRQFIQIYCDTKHIDSEKTEKKGLMLCTECHKTMVYSRMQRELCPLNPKPTCKNCEIHCYKPDQRQRIREIMRHSGMHFIKRGRIDMLLHYLL
ncbi:nitrous oxide-stimulated promoter family protein [Thermoproteota archaeon]